MEREMNSGRNFSEDIPEAKRPRMMESPRPRESGNEFPTPRMAHMPHTAPSSSSRSDRESHVIRGPVDLAVPRNLSTSSGEPDRRTERVKEENNKENYFNSDNAPMDLSKKSSSDTPDVITLSDSEDDGKLGMVDILGADAGSLSKEEFVKRLQEELRNEEAKLVLFKKLRHSQRSRHSDDSSSMQNKAHVSRPPTQPAQPPPARSSNQVPINKAQMAHSGHSGNRSSPQIQPSRHGQPQMQGSNMSRHSSSSQMQRQMPPGMSPGQSMMAGYHGMSKPSTPTTSHSSSQQSVPQVDPGQRQAAAKLALRKQLEKTLLQIPPPKPPPPEMNFIPSLACNEFILLVGLEEVVKTLTELDAESRGEKSHDVKYVCTPFSCVQCGTDFTPVWKREKPGSKNVICENCVTTNQKKALKQEHTNRLKSAFVKALQQEQEIEQRIQAQPAVTVAPTPPQPQQPQVAPAYSPSAAQFLPQNLIQAHQSALRASAAHLAIPTFSPRIPFPFPYAAAGNVKASDLQRQYLLDMIPPRSLHPSQMGWNTK